MTEATLVEGLRTKPLAGYLSAVGLLRLLAEQVDPEITGRWRGEAFELGGIGLDTVCQFLVEGYRPTPVFSPWNKEGDPQRNDTTARQLHRIRDTPDGRFDLYRETLAAFETVSRDPAWTDAGIAPTQDKVTKAQRLRIWRSWAPDATLPWLDAAVVLTVGDVAYSPLLGTGGNDGRFEASRLFQGELIRLFVDSRTRKSSEGWLRSLLTGAAGPPLIDSTLGQYDADAAGGINAGALATPSAASNPWSIVLVIEGTMALAAGAMSRLGVGAQSLTSVPFMVRSSAIDGDAGNEASRGEFWAPIWDRPAQWREVRKHFAEGRLQWNGRRAASALDAARAVGSLGTSRGVVAFQRFGFLNRNGKSFLAAPRGSVIASAVRGVPLLAALDQWIVRLPYGDSVPASLTAARKLLDRAMFGLVAADEPRRASPRCDGELDAETARSYQEVLIALAAVEGVVGRSDELRKKARPIALDRVPAAEWIPLIDDGSSELRLAVGLASLHDPDPPRPNTSGPDNQLKRWPSERRAGLALRGLTTKDGSLRWPSEPDASDPAVRQFIKNQDRVPLELLTRRLHSAASAGDNGEERELDVAAFSRGISVPLRDVVALLNGDVNRARLVSLARACAVMGAWPSVCRWPDVDGARALPTPPWFAALRLCFTDKPIDATNPDGERRPIWVLADRSWGRQLGADRVSNVATEASALLRRYGFSPLRAALPAPHRALDRDDIAVALLCRLSGADLDAVRRVLDPSYDQPGRVSIDVNE